ncbi:MAG: hypothetical protein CMP77_15200 [Flavobacterium sp.]|nr:hypothetical protein [Pseudozobellia sp.]MBF01305.1 hypothetical protein [Flavobacterium sp.]MBG49107.1 hypothetical protein [Pseudozobellia sp.]|tara:strand:- start:5269 stop:6624 length:1356 start_codon:yes stop_codon:yes gene_type:complete
MEDYIFGSVKRRLFVTVLSVLVSACSKSDGDKPSPLPEPAEIQVETVTFGGSLNDSGKALVKTNDGGFAVLGHTQSNDGDVSDKDAEDFDFWLMKFDAQSGLEWTKSYGGSENDRGSDLVQTADGGFALLGFSESSNRDVSENGGSLDYWLAKIDANGNLLWQKSFGYKGRDEGISLIETKDQGYLLVGVLDVTASEGQGNQTARNHAGGDYWAVKINSSGDIEWSQYYGGTFTDTAYDVVEMNEGGYLIVGSSDSFDVDISDNKGTYDFWVVRITDIGELLWEKNFGGSEIDEAKAIIPTFDGNFLIVGDTRSNDQDVSSNKGAADIWVVKIDGAGDLVWEQTYGGSGFDAASSVVAASDGGYLIAGNSRSGDGDLQSNQGQNDAWVLKINDEGIIVWQRSVGGSQIDLAAAVIELNGEKVLAVGESASDDFDVNQNKGFTDVLLLAFSF